MDNINSLSVVSAYLYLCYCIDHSIVLTAEKLAQYLSLLKPASLWTIFKDYLSNGSVKLGTINHVTT